MGESGSAESLRGRTALVTGAGSGIGYAIARRFSEAGAKVVINYLTGEREAQRLARDLPTEATAIQADVSRKPEVDRMLKQAIGRFGKLDILVNNAGIEAARPILELTEADWDRELNVNLRGAFLCLQAAAREMAKSGGGSIVNISSVHEDHPFPGFTPYCASKGGLRMLMRNAALELAPHRIRVNNVAPGAIRTPINEATLEDPEKMARLGAIVPLGRMGNPEEVAEVALFLASDASAYVTGSTYYVDGGLVRYSEPL